VTENSQILILQKAILRTQAEQTSLKATVDLLLSESNSKQPPKQTNKVPPLITTDVNNLKTRLDLLEKRLTSSETTSSSRITALESRIVAGEQLSLSLGVRLDKSLTLINKLNLQTQSAYPNVPEPEAEVLSTKSNATSIATCGISSELVARCEMNLEKSMSVFNGLDALAKKMQTMNSTIQYGDGVSMTGNRLLNSGNAYPKLMTLDIGTQLPEVKEKEPTKKAPAHDITEQVNMPNSQQPPKKEPAKKAPAHDLSKQMNRAQKPTKKEPTKKAPVHVLTDVQRGDHVKRAPSLNLQRKPPSKAIPNHTTLTASSVDATISKSNTFSKDKVESVPARKVEGTVAKTGGQRTQVLLIHGRHHEAFDSGLFDSRMQVMRLQADSSAGLSKQERLTTALKKSNPSVIIIHLGMEQLLANRSTDQIVKHHRELIDHLLANTDARICVSQIIPSPNDPALDSSIRNINSELQEWSNVTSRVSSIARTRLFTYNNNSLSKYMTEDGPSLNKSGTNLLMSHLKFAILRANHGVTATQFIRSCHD